MDVSSMFFQNWPLLLRTVLLSAMAFLVLVILLRILGKRMLLITSASSLAMTVALGNALATAALDDAIDIAETTTGFAVLMGLQWIIFKLVARSSTLQTLSRSREAVVFLEGKMLSEVMRQQHVAEEDVYAAIRENGYADVEEVGAVVFESSGKLSVIPGVDDGVYPVLAPIMGGKKNA
jgi:uncharacterized membrane protein YcaP (DUF421 family)